jgi:hypothetical protein
MAVGRSKQVSPEEVSVVSGKAGRLSAPPEGGLYVRDVAAARARAVAERVAAFEAVGLEVPEELAAMAAEFQVSDEDEVINLVDAVTGELLAEGAVDEVGVVLEEIAAGQPPLAPEPEPEPEPELQPEVVDVGSVPFDVDSLTVAELKAELDLLGVEHDVHDRKADLQEKLRAALQE